MRKIQEIRWEEGSYNFLYGFINNKQLFSISWNDGNYKLYFEYINLKREFALDNDREVLKERAKDVLKFHINSFYE